MEQLNNLDVVFLVIMGVSMLVGLARGFTKELLSVMGWLIAGASVYYLLPVVDPITKKYIASALLANIVSGMIIVIVVCIFWVLTADKISSVIRQSKLSPLDRLFGLMFGFARGLALIIVFNIMITAIIPTDSQKGVFKDSEIFKTAGQMADPFKSMLPKNWEEDFQNKLADMGLSSDKSKEKDGEKAEEKVEEKSIAEAKNKNKDLKKNSKKEKSSDEAFIDLAQPKTATDTIDEKIEMKDVVSKVADKVADKVAEKIVNKASEKTSYDEDDTSDLEMLMDAIEEKTVSDDTKTVTPEQNVKVTPQMLQDVVNKIGD